MAGGKQGRYYEDSDWRNDVNSETPYTIYFYWATPKKDVEDEFDVVVYMWVSDTMITTGAMLDTLIRNLAANALDRGTDPRPIGSGFTVPWWRKSYVVVALAGEGGFEPNDAMDIVYDDDGHDRLNHTFFDGEDRVMKDAKDRWISVTWTVNYMKTRGGANLPDGEVQKFRLRFKAKGKDFRDPEDHGTNMGPPIGPPP